MIITMKDIITRRAAAEAVADTTMMKKKAVAAVEMIAKRAVAAAEVVAAAVEAMK
jgi:hypothetical protein